MRRLDIGIASYGNFQKLRRTIDSIKTNSVTDWRLFVIDNPSEDPRIRPWLIAVTAEDSRIVPIFLDENIGYAGAVKKLQETAESEYLGYCDNDVVIQTRGWDEILCGYLDRFHEIGMVFPNCGPYPINRPAYTEVMWGVGFCWILSRMAMLDTGHFDTEIGHQEEADYCLRLRMAGYRCGAAPQVQVAHDASATTNPASIERINRGVVNFVNKWNRYFNGKNFNYHSLNVTRWEDWPPNALYLEEYFKQHVSDLNLFPEKVDIQGIQYDYIKVPRLSGFYTGRII